MDDSLLVGFVNFSENVFCDNFVTETRNSSDLDLGIIVAYGFPPQSGSDSWA